MCKYIAPLVQNNSGLKKGSVANVIIRDVRISTHLMIIMRYMIYMKRLQAKVLMLKEDLR